MDKQADSKDLFHRTILAPYEGPPLTLYSPYLRRTLRSLRSPLPLPPGPIAVLLTSDDLPDERRRLVASWQESIVGGVKGDTLDLGAFPELVVDNAVPDTDQRWLMAGYAMNKYKEATEVEVTEVEVRTRPSPLIPVTALQVVLGGRKPHVRLNGAIKGHLWAIAGPDWLYAGLDLPASELGDCHITILSGLANGQDAFLTFWDMDMDIIRGASPDWLIKKQLNSIGIPGAKGRFRKLIGSEGKPVIAEGVRSAFFEARQLGIHPDRLGTWIVDSVEATNRGGLPSRQSGKVVETTLAETERDPVNRLDSKTEWRDLQQEVKGLDARSTEILHRHYILDETDAEIGRSLGISQQGVNTLRNKAVAALKRHLSPQAPV
ncbi:MAG: hypothetical protein HY681_15095 [Chloroflexi bacterium]|nr:hypothetical protein [Chloroflexota bacterium]